MEKFISIPNTLGANQLVSANDVVGIFAGTAGTNTAALADTVIMYQGGKVVTLKHVAQTAFNMRNAIQDAVNAALQTSWTHPVYVIPALPISVTLITAA